jgi:cytochrome c oxidase assembly protein subunit 15
MALVDVLPMPEPCRAQRLIAAAVVLTQGGIAVTGAIVRVTASGWAARRGRSASPAASRRCHTPKCRSIHQAVEFGNRMITFLVVLTAALAVLAVTRARRRREVSCIRWLMPASTVMQAVIGGITVLTGLLWWTVAIHCWYRWRWSGWPCCVVRGRSANPTTERADRPSAEGRSAAVDSLSPQWFWPRNWYPAPW